MINQPSAVVSESSTMDVVSSASHSVTQTTSTSDVTTTCSNATGQSKTTQKEVVYTAASEELISARKFIAEYSFPRAHDRLLHIRSIREDDQKQLSENKMVSELYKNSRSLTLNSSQYGDERPMSTIRYSPYGNILATGSFNSTVKLWDAYTLDNLSILHGHEERITSISWHPNAFNESSGSTTANNTSTTYGLLATTSASTTCNIYKVDVSRNTDEMDISTHNNNIKNQSSHNQSSASSSISINHTLIQQLHGHQQGISSCEFHPSGRYIGTSSYDYTWHLYDVETGSELLLQDGHSKECATINFQHDGALVSTSDYAGVVLVWDLRSGQQVQSFQGHVKKITSTCFHPNGFQIVSGGTDNTARIWDLRKRKCAYVIPAHLNILSDLSLSASGELLATSSFDGTIKVWGMRDYRLLQTLKGHEGKVMSCDFSCDEKHLVSAGFDKTIKMWSHKDEY